MELAFEGRFAIVNNQMLKVSSSIYPKDFRSQRVDWSAVAKGILADDLRCSKMH